MLYLGLDVGGTKIAAVVMDENGSELYKNRTQTIKGSYNDFLSHLVMFIKEIINELDDNVAIGIAIPGSISSLSGKVKNSNILVLNGKSFKEDIERVLCIPVSVDNDGNCFTLSESCDGAGSKSTVVYGITLGTGCGGGLVINNLPLRGAYGNAAETGHIHLPGYTPEVDGPPVSCYCGKINCAESFVSGTGLSERYYANTGSELTAPEIISLARNGDSIAKKHIDQFRDQLSRLISTVINIIDPDVIVLGGGLSNVDMLTENLSPLVEKYVFTDHYCTPILIAHHGDTSGMRGAAWLAIKEYNS